MTVKRIVNFILYGFGGLLLFYWLHIYQTQGWIFWLVVGAGIIIFMGILAEVVILLFLEPVKRKMLQDFPRDMTFLNAQPSDYPDLDHVTLDRWTDALKYLGFQLSQDLSIRPESGSHFPQFVRVLIHPRHHCFAEIHQIFPPPTPGKVEAGVATIACTITSDLGQLVLSTTNRPVMASLWIMRLPTYLWESFPDRQPRELWERHLHIREQLMQDYNLDLSHDLTINDYYKGTETILAMQRQEIENKDIVKLINEFNNFPKNPRHEWWGKYQKFQHF